MMRSLLAIAALVTVSLPMAASGSPVHPRLDAKVTGKGISLTDANGRRVSVLQQNSYRFVIKDASKAQNFHLTGPSVNRKTGVAVKVTRVWVANLRPGTYVYKSDRNTKLRGTFVVEPGPPPA